ncbi:MAG: hypothetical protein LBQ49_02595 [Rickettsiales bacterium]|jgi:hypothetical protein|nr:hypothetical protein [Rickettsiales bacterium]
MNKLALFIVNCSLLIVPAYAASRGGGSDQGGGRQSVMSSGPGSGSDQGRPSVIGAQRPGGTGTAATKAVTIPVTTTTTTTTNVPEINETETNSNTVNYDLGAMSETGLRNACLMGATGSVWANKAYARPDGVAADMAAAMTEHETAGENACFYPVAIKSADIKNMGRFFPPRHFMAGATVECGSWIDAADLDAAILDAKKNARTGWTIAASVGGAALGVGAVEGIGAAGGWGDKYQGQRALEGVKLINAQLKSPKTPDKFKNDVMTVYNWCNGGSQAERDARATTPLDAKTTCKDLVAGIDAF